MIFLLRVYSHVGYLGVKTFLLASFRLDIVCEIQTLLSWKRIHTLNFLREAIALFTIISLNLNECAFLN